MYFIRPACICSVVTLLLFATAPCFALEEWPDGPHKEWFENLRRPDNICTPNEPCTPSRNTAVNDIVQRRRSFRHVNHEFWIVT